MRDYLTQNLVRKDMNVNKQERLSNTKLSKKGYECK